MAHGAEQLAWELGVLTYSRPPTPAFQLSPCRVVIASVLQLDQLSQPASSLQAPDIPNNSLRSFQHKPHHDVHCNPSPSHVLSRLFYQQLWLPHQTHTMVYGTGAGPEDEALGELYASSSAGLAQWFTASRIQTGKVQVVPRAMVGRSDG
jgi:hypothetical protein